MDFQQAISHYKHKWAIARCLKALLLLMAAFLVALILYGIADAVWALSNDSRSLINKLLIVFTAITAVLVVYRIFKTTRDEVSTIADSAISNDSASIRAAHDLSKQSAISPLNNYLSLQAQEKAVKELGSIPLKVTISCKHLIIAILVLISVAGIGYAIRGFHPENYDTVAARLQHPDRDIPPYSPLRFKVSQDAQNTVYGGENQVRVEITGGELEHDVLCRVRNKRSGKIEMISTFQESSNKFSKKFSNILNDIEYSFSCGKARSEWKTIHVLTQPKFTHAHIKITPPAYTKRKSLEFSLEGNEIRVISGSTIELTISSNRPLSGGDLIVKTDSPTENKDKPIRATHSEASPKQVNFRWVAANTSHILCTIQDIRGTVSAEPLEFHVVTRADLAPVAELTSPARLVLATPNSKIPLKGTVEDDYEVDSVYLVRTLVGFRDRAREIATSLSNDRFDFGEMIDLAKLGVEEKQTLEFYLEANDRNPSLLGIGTSDVVRVKIISEDEYAQRLRRQAKIEAFNTRYHILVKVIKDTVKSLRDLNAANRKNVRNPFEQMTKKSQQVHQQSRTIVLKIAEDFEAFDLESQLTKAAMVLGEKMLTNYDQLSNLQFDQGVGHNELEIKEMINRLGASLEKAKQLENKAKTLSNFGKVARQAALFRKYFKNQESIATRITNIAKEIQTGVKRNAQRTRILGKTQQKNKKRILKIAQDLKKTIAELPEELDTLQHHCEVWLEKMEELNLPDAMDAVTLSTKVGKSHDAATKAFLAYSLMKQLVDMEQNEFAKMIRNEPPKHENDKELEKTMRQILEALHNRHQGQGKNLQLMQKHGGRGNQNNPLGGQGPGPSSGYRTNPNVPMFGPNRSDFSQPQRRGMEQGQNKRQAENKNTKISERNSIESLKKRDTKASQASRTNVPNKYKDAVKRFYSDPSNKLNK